MGRISKFGQLDQEKLINAILNPPVITRGKYNWTLTDAFKGTIRDEVFIYGRMSKFKTEGLVKLVDRENRAQVDVAEEDILNASSPFVYLPEFSGIAYLHVWNELQEEIFSRRFCSIIQAAYGDFFVKCEIEPINNYKSFIAKLGEFDIITDIKATVHPPNPLFGRMWGDLRVYIERRRAKELKIQETTTEPGGIKTRIREILLSILNNPNYIPQENTDITDAALLMSADGYGRGKVEGKIRGEAVQISTKELQKSFLFDKEPTPQLLAQQAKTEFERTSAERGMEH